MVNPSIRQSVIPKVPTLRFLLTFLTSISRTVVWQLGTAKQQCRSRRGQVYAIGLATSAALRI